MNDWLDPTLPQDVQQVIRKNMPYDPRVVGGSVLGANEDPNVLAWVDARFGPTMFFNRRSVNPQNPTTPGHELEHILQNRVNRRYPEGYDMSVVDQLHKTRFKDKHSDVAEQSPLGTMHYNEMIRYLTQNLKRVGADAELRNYLEKISGIKPGPYIGGMPNNQYSLKEQFAELSSFEQYMKKDLTKDPIIRERFFNNDQHLIDTYKATTGLRMDRLDAKDLPPMTVIPTNTKPIKKAEPEKKSIMQTLKDIFK